MKKTIVLLAIALASTAAQAQYYYGGGYYRHDRGDVAGQAVVVGSLAGLFAASSTLSATSGCYNCNYDQAAATKTITDIQELRMAQEMGTPIQMDADLAQKLTDAKKITNADDTTTLNLLNQAAYSVLNNTATTTTDTAK